jgi:hypothetical protein
LKLTKPLLNPKAATTAKLTSFSSTTLKQQL